MTAVDDLLDGTAKPDPSAAIKRDRWGRYLIPDPATGTERAWTRVTTLVDALDDKAGLTKWDERNIVYGIGKRKDLYALAAAATLDDKRDLGDIAWKAKQAAQSSAGANTGTALHRFTERLDLGEITPADVPDDWRPDVLAYQRAMTAAGILVVPGWTERILVIPEVSAAGTADRLVDHLPAWPHPRIGDLKTGKVDKGWLKIAMQLATYSRATHWYDPATGEVHPITETIDRDLAVVMHLPPESGECTLYAVDIAFGWEAAQVAYEVREKYRKRKDIARVIEAKVVEAPAVEAPPVATDAPGGGEGAAPPVTGAPSPPAPPASAERVAWLKDRVQTLYGLGHGADLEARWIVALVPPPISDDYTDEQVSTASAWCDQVEAEHEVPWGTVDPLFAPFFEPPAEPPAEPAPHPDPLDDARHWTDKAKAILGEFDDHEVAAIAAAAGMTPEDSRMTERRYFLVEVLVTDLSDEVDPSVMFTYDEHGAHVVPVPRAAALMEAMCAGPDGKSLGKSAALTRAKAWAKALGLPAPRGLAKAAEHPLLAALVAGGREAP